MAEQKKTFRWEIVGVLIAIVVAAWLLDGVRTAFTWSDVLDWAQVRDRARFTRLCILGLCVIGVLVVARVLRPEPKE